MSPLAKVLRRYKDLDPVPAGGGDKRRRLTEEQRKCLRLDLELIGKRNGRMIVLASVLLVLVFVASMVMIFKNSTQPHVVESTVGALGLSAAGCIRWLLKIWQRKNSIEILLRLAVDLEGEALKTVIVVLASGKAL